ncbi:assimilatory sulfite reductase (NADPH) flavoprotein subunit [Nitrococcus mobilis]|uniref:Sulfite reductase [NADPH] flavoprotein alpha-component n=1 Tax=Nitrococcus mobilis Nb-231 TaxID=314278 RepID=A4BVP1_9GAMM|nr:assimilatory sulfite reductase (NADPH) flavoprotein subunit [Nitrococcus mobilis]EAR20223.1 Sulphite reductase (NADPH) flavoprotein, alpha chain [Nitrococcus mobilis Nb-231]
MAQGPLLDTNSPLNAEQAARLNELLATLHNDQMTWISGYLAGLAAGSGAANAMVSEAITTESLPAITILFGSETGNAQGLAQLAAERAQRLGFQANVANMADFRKSDLKKVDNLMVVVSTHGEGDPPDPAEEFYALMHGRKAPALKGKRFTVLALGDSSYENFCQTGHDFDARLEALGAERIYPCVDCDVDFDDPASDWIDAVLECFGKLTGAQPRPSNVVAFSSRSAEKTTWSRKNPYPATVLENIVLNGRGSSKETRHIELSIEDSGLTFEPGDSLGVVPQNNPVYVERLVETLGLQADTAVAAGDDRASLHAALTQSYEITTITRPFLERYAALTESNALQALLREEAKTDLRQYIHGRHILDVIQDYPVKGLAAEDFIGTLRKLPPRLYSIASSHRVAPDEVHLTVAAVRYHSHGLNREGVASTFLADRIVEGETVPVYVDSNPNFRLPTDPQTPIIMVGPGTGVAPFRAFLAEREELGAAGRNWLFFGDRNFLSDFLYQIEWLNWRKRGLLTRIDVAFSRDQAEKVYVQHRMRENARELYAWLEEGASFYVCGDGEGMAHDVHQALLDIVREQGGLSDDQALDYVRRLQKEKRYQKDVY